MNKAILFLLVVFLPGTLLAQGTLSGDLQTNINFFMKDSAIGAAGNPLYDNYLSGSEGWLSLRYNIKEWTFTMRVDEFNNSNLANPTQAATAYGVGAYSITREVEGLTITVGNIYDQIGNGIVFRSYEDRGLLIDNAVVGLELKYKLGKKVLLKGFTGQQKNLFDKYQPIMRGFNAESDYTFGKTHIAPGIGVLNRTLDQVSMNKVAEAINSQELTTRFLPRWNMYAFSVYNTLNYKNVSWSVEGDYKTHEATVINNLFYDKAGNVLFSTLNYAKKGFAVNVSAKRTENFTMRTSPNEVLLQGMLNWQPVIARQRPERLISRYTPASQDLSEMASTVDVLYTPSDVTTYTFTYTNIDKLDNTKLYRELFGQIDYLGLKSWGIQAGIQYLEYNMVVYRASTLAYLYAVTPFTEITYRINDTKSLRLEAQYMDTKQDYGSWIFALLEYNLAPKFSVSVSDMYNVSPNLDNPAVTKAIHYYSVYGAFTKGPHRLSLAYVKQVAGINCTGGVCRYEPAFSGIRCTLTTRF